MSRAPFKLPAAPEPKTLPRKLFVIQPGAVRAITDFFECAPLGAKLFARACVARQQAARARVLLHPTCANCAAGLGIARRVGVDVGGRELVPTVVREVDRRARAGRRAHAAGQSFHRTPDDPEAA